VKLETPAASARSDDFSTYVNPYLGSLLSELDMLVAFKRGRGTRLYTDDGRTILDFVAGHGALPFGHAPPRIVRAVQRAAAEPIFVQPSRLDHAGALARRLIELAPPGYRCALFTNSGAETVELAIKAARLATGRRRIVSARNSFHGKTSGALSATGNPAYQAPFGLPYPDYESVPFNDIDALRAVLEARGDEIALVLLEPVQGEGGVIPAERAYLEACRALCDRHRVLLAFDEIQTGFGRIGRMFGAELYGVTPDILILAKALGGGVAGIGACLLNAAANDPALGQLHSSTFAMNGLACSAALATLDEFERLGSGLLDNVAARGEQLREGLEALRRRYPQVVADVRSAGLLAAIELTRDRDALPPGLLAVAADTQRLGPLVAAYLFAAENVRVVPALNGSNVIRIEPPLNVTAADCEAVLRALDAALAIVAAGDTAALMQSIRTRTRVRPMLRRLSSAGNTSRASSAHEVAVRRFAFVVHPETWDSYRDYDPSVRDLDSAAYREVVGPLHRLGQAAVIERVRVTARDGSTADGEFVAVPHTAAELAEMPARDSTRVVQSAVARACQSPRSIVGLGGFSSVVTQSGLNLDPSGTSLTSGNAFTAISAADACAHVMRKRRPREAGWTVCVVGAAGSIGRGISLLLASSPAIGRMWLVGSSSSNNSELRLQALRHELAARAFAMRAEHPGWLSSLAGDACTSAEQLAQAATARGVVLTTTDAQPAIATSDLIITATSATGDVLDPRLLKPNAVIVDVGRPPNVSDAVCVARPQVQLIRAGIVKTPAPVDLSSLGLPQGAVYACMAETMVLALSGRPDLATLGPRIDIDRALEIGALARTLGFETILPPDAE
jgi:acetylornithine/succinyldiaminopimelate/putrescine aminotransferase/predicted amino acid dehydrogenase